MFRDTLMLALPTEVTGKQIKTKPPCGMPFWFESTTEIRVGYWFFPAVKACLQCLGFKKIKGKKEIPFKRQVNK
jgi:hypothetical protein